MLVHAATIVGLKCSFHCSILIYVIIFTLLGCKITHIFRNHKEICNFYPFFLCFFLEFQ